MIYENAKLNNFNNTSTVEVQHVFLCLTYELWLPGSTGRRSMGRLFQDLVRSPDSDGYDFLICPVRLNYSLVLL